MSKERITRRRFLRDCALIAAGLCVSGCRVRNSTKATQEETELTKQPKISSPTPTETPTKTPTNTPLPTKTPTPEPTSTPEPLVIQGRVIDEEYLKNAFAGIGGSETVKGEVSAIEFEDYVSQAWGKD